MRRRRHPPPPGTGAASVPPSLFPRALIAVVIIIAATAPVVPAADAGTTGTGTGIATPPISQCPCVRYVPWDDLPPTPQRHARRLGYYRDTWDYVDSDSNPLEELSFDALSTDQRDDAMALGYETPQIWDCCVNHYVYYYWAELGELYPAAQEAWGGVGYSRRSWDYDLDIHVNYKTWCRNATGVEEDVCMSAGEVHGAAELCYTGSSYRGDGMGGVPFATYDKPDHCRDGPVDAVQPKEAAVPSAGGVPNAASADVIGSRSGSYPDYHPPVCPCVRYTPWDDLTPLQTHHARNLGYARNTWNYADRARNPLEDLYFVALTPEQQSNATALGYSPENHGHQWTCCVNHYMWHHWGHMGNWHPEAQAAYSDLGWEKQRWNLWRDLPPSHYKVWCRNVTSTREDVCLSPTEIYALHRVCHTESTHREDSLAGAPFGTFVKPDYCVDDDAAAAAPPDAAPADNDGGGAATGVPEDAGLPPPLPSEALPPPAYTPLPADGPTLRPTAGPAARPAAMLPVTDAPIASRDPRPTSSSSSEGERPNIDSSGGIPVSPQHPPGLTTTEPVAENGVTQSASAGSTSLTRSQMAFAPFFVWFLVPQFLLLLN